MNIARLLAAAALLAGASVGAHADQTIPRPDAPDAVSPFLPAPAQSLAQLVREVRRDATIRARYADFFHVPEAAVAPYLGRTLRPARLRRAGSYTVYYVSTAGAFYPTRMALSPGTPVFVGRDGAPVLLGGAGNPLTPFSMVVSRIVYAPAGVMERAAPASVKEQIMPAGVREQVVPAGADIPVSTSAP